MLRRENFLPFIKISKNFDCNIDLSFGLWAHMYLLGLPWVVTFSHLCLLSSNIFHYFLTTYRMENILTILFAYHPFLIMIFSPHTHFHFSIVWIEHFFFPEGIIQSENRALPSVEKYFSSHPFFFN